MQPPNVAVCTKNRTNGQHQAAERHCLYEKSYKLAVCDRRTSQFIRKIVQTGCMRPPNISVCTKNRTSWLYATAERRSLYEKPYKLAVCNRRTSLFIRKIVQAGCMQPPNVAVCTKNRTNGQHQAAERHCLYEKSYKLAVCDRRTSQFVRKTVQAGCMRPQNISVCTKNRTSWLYATAERRYLYEKSYKLAVCNRRTSQFVRKIVQTGCMQPQNVAVCTKNRTNQSIAPPPQANYYLHHASRPNDGLIREDVGLNRLETINFQNNPFMGSFFTEAELFYKGYFHTHGGIELLMVHEGKGSVTIPQHVYKMESGALFLFQPYQLHHVRAVNTEHDPYVRSVLQFDPVALAPYIKPYKQLEQILTYIWKGKLPQQAFFDLPKRYPLEQDLRFFQQNYANDKERRLEHYALLILRILQYLQQEIAAWPISIEPSAVQSTSALPHTEAILSWIEQHYAEPFELERLADELHLSKYHVSHLFKEVTGHTVTEYLLALRSKEACQLLVNSTLPVAEIGARVGWPIPSHFIQQFKRWVGCTPLQYRKRNQF